MHKRKTHLQKHRMAAFLATLQQISQRIDNKISFLEGYSDIYKMPIMLTRQNLQKLRTLQKAANTLKSIEISQI